MVQHKLLSFLSYRFYVPMNCFDHDFSTVSRYFDLPTVRSIHEMYDIVFLYKVSNDLINHTYIKNLFVLRNVEKDLRDFRRIVEHESKFDYILFSSVFRLERLLSTNFNLISNSDSLFILKESLSYY